MDKCLKGFVSDHLIMLEILKEFQASKDRKAYCSLYSLHHDTCLEVLVMQKELSQALAQTYSSFPSYSSSLLSLPSASSVFDLNASCNRYSNEVSALFNMCFMTQIMAV